MSFFDANPDSFLGRAQEWMTPERGMAIQGLGLGLSQLAAGQPVNLTQSHQALMQRQQSAQMRQRLEESGITSRFTPDQQAILAMMPPEAAARIIAQEAFRPAPEPTRGVNIGGRLVNPVTGAVMADFSTPDDRRIITGADGFNYYSDTGERVLPGVTPALDTPTAPSSVREYEFAVQQGYPGTFEDWQLAQGGAGASNINVINAGADEFAEAFARGDAEMLGTMTETGLAASRNIPRINELERLLSDAPSGIAGAAALRAGDFGINTDGLDDLQAANAIISSLVPEQRQPGSGPMSDADLDLFRQSLPRIINQPGGNERIVNTIRGIAEYDAQGAAIVQSLRAGEITRSEAFEQLQNRVNPLDGFDAGEAAAPVLGAPVTVESLQTMSTAEITNYLDRVDPQDIPDDVLQAIIQGGALQ